MSQSEIARFPRNVPARDNNPDAAHEARRRISGLSDPYLNNAAPAKEDLVGAVQPVSPAAEGNPSNQSIEPPLRIGNAANEGPKAETGHLAIASPPTNLLPTPIAAASAGTASTAVKPANPLEGALQPQPQQYGKRSPNPEDPKPRSLAKRLMPLAVGAVTFILLFLLFKAPIFLNQLSYFTGSAETQSTPAKAPAAAAVTVPPEPIISIPKINVNAPIVFARSNVEAAIQKDLESGVVHYSGTAVPGTAGNSVIFGHSSNDWWEPGDYKFVFVLLDKLEAGDTFTVNYNSKQYIYEVTGKKVVPPTDVSVLNQTADPQLTLITCTPPGTSWQRLIVSSKQISPAPNAKPAVDPNEADKLKENGTLPGNAPSLGEKISAWWKRITGGQ